MDSCVHTECVPTENDSMVIYEARIKVQAWNPLYLDHLREPFGQADLEKLFDGKPANHHINP